MPKSIILNGDNENSFGAFVLLPQQGAASTEVCMK